MDTGTVFLPILRSAHLALLMVAFGTQAFALLVVPGGLREAPETAGPLRASLARLGQCSLLLGMALGLVWFGVAAGTIAGSESASAWLAALPHVAGATRFGGFLMLRLALLAACLLVLRRVSKLAVALTALAVVLQPMFGHAGAVQGGAGWMLLGAEALHVLAAGAWLGGLVPLLLCVARLPPTQAALVCERFTPLGLLSVGIIATTALLQASQLVGSLPALLGTPYGRVALIKLALLVVALGLAMLNRLRLTPALAGRAPSAARRRLLLSIGLETTIGLAIVVAAGCLATLTPATQQQPLWPFDRRPSFDSLDDLAVRTQVALALVAAGVGVAGIVFGLLWRRGRIALLVFGACLLLAAVPAGRLLLVEAYPTSYFHSPTAFAAASIVHGRDVFAANCVVCHGAEGRGDGPLASQLLLRPADLTAPHIWGHSDGELFWWISNGRRAPGGAQVMPGFAPVLSTTDRWNVIDFVRANNAGVSQRTSGAWVVPIVAPSLPVVCAGLPASGMQDLHGSVVRIVADGDEDGAAHPPAIPPQVGYKVVILHLDRSSWSRLPAGECMAATPAAWDAYATLVGLRSDALAGTEFLVDPKGWLRAAWLPSSGRGWSTPDQLIAQVRLICTHPIASEAGGEHEHHD